MSMYVPGVFAPVSQPGAPKPQVTFFDDFFHIDASGSPDGATWHSNVTGSGTAAGSGATAISLGGIAYILTEGVDNSSGYMTANGGCWQLATGRNVMFEARVKITTTQSADWFVGLVEVDRTSLDTGASIDAIGFGGLGTNAGGVTLANSGGKIFAVSAKDCNFTALEGDITTRSANETATDTTRVMPHNATATVGAAGWTTLRVVMDGLGYAEFWVDGSRVATHRSDIPSAKLTPLLWARNDGAIVHQVYVDYVLVTSDRGDGN